MTFNEITETKFYILSGSLSDLSRLDFSHLNIQCMKINSPEFNSVLENMKIDEHDTKTSSFFEELYKKYPEEPSLYILLPIDFNKEFNESELFICFEIILLLHPSDISVYGILEFQLLDYKYLDWVVFTEFGEKYSWGYQLYENHLFYDTNNLEHINKFIKIYHERVREIPYLKIPIDSYLSSFSERNPTMSFLSLCICLESIIDGSNELVYRIKRNVSILCGNSKARAEIIFKNVDLIYKLRSKIVHGEDYKLEKIQDHLPYLRKLVSRVIIKLVLLNIKSKETLSTSLTFSGFGIIEDSSSDYIKLEPNLGSFVDTFRTILTK